MEAAQRSARITGVLFLITFITSIAALILFQPVLDDPEGYIAGGGSDGRIYLGVLLELLLIVANIGTAVVPFVAFRRQNETLALGYVTARIMECVLIAVGILAVLAVVTLRTDAGADAASLGGYAESLAALKDWTFLLGPGFVVGIGNGLILGYLMYRSGLVPRKMAMLGLIGGPLIILSGDRRPVRPLRSGQPGAGHRDDPRVPLGAVARHLPHGQGVQDASRPPRGDSIRLSATSGRGCRTTQRWPRGSPRHILVDAAAARGCPSCISDRRS